MRYLQGKWLTGYVVFSVKNEHLNSLLQRCIMYDVHVWNVIEKDDQTFLCSVRSYDFNKIKTIAEEQNYDITLKQVRGLPYVLKYFAKQKQLVLAIIASLFLFLILSNIIWRLEITGVSTELEHKINEVLTDHHVYKGQFVYFIKQPGELQYILLQEIPELLWIGVEKQGATLKLSGIEKITQDHSQENHPQHLIAAKSGVIEHMNVRRGIPLVKVNDFVQKGDLLVSGSMADVFEAETEKELEEKSSPSVRAEGEVIAKTWYEIDVTVPLEHKQTIKTGANKHKYYLNIGKSEFLVWGFQEKSYSEQITERQIYEIPYINKYIPLRFVKKTMAETKSQTYNRTKEEAIDAGIEQVKDQLSLKLKENAKVLSQKVLHESTQNGKVKLTLFITVAENITKEQPITQGD